MEVEIKAVKAWGVERDGKLLPQAEDCRPPFPWVGERDVRVRILREADYRRLLKTAGTKGQPSSLLRATLAGASQGAFGRLQCPPASGMSKTLGFWQSGKPY